MANWAASCGKNGAPKSKTKGESRLACKGCSQAVSEFKRSRHHFDLESNTQNSGEVMPEMDESLHVLQKLRHIFLEKLGNGIEYLSLALSSIYEPVTSPMGYPEPWTLNRKNTLERKQAWRISKPNGPWGNLCARVQKVHVMARFWGNKVGTNQIATFCLVTIIRMIKFLYFLCWQVKGANEHGIWIPYAKVTKGFLGRSCIIFSVHIDFGDVHRMMMVV